MPEIDDFITVEDGWVMGNIATNKVGSDCKFPVCTVHEYENMTEEQAVTILVDTIWESGYCNVNF